MTIPLLSSWIASVDVAPRGNLVLCGTPEGPVIVPAPDSLGVMVERRASLEMRSSLGGGPAQRSEPIKFSGHDGGVTIARFTGSALNFISGSTDHTAALWDSSTKQIITRFEGHGGDVTDLSFNRNIELETFFTSSADSTAKMWDLRTGEVVSTFAGHEADVNSLEVSKCGNLLVTGSTDATCQLFDIRNSGKSIVTLSDLSVNADCEAVAFSPQGYHVVAGYKDGQLLAWNLINTHYAQLKEFDKSVGTLKKIWICMKLDHF